MNALLIIDQTYSSMYVVILNILPIIYSSKCNAFDFSTLKRLNVIATLVNKGMYNLLSALSIVLLNNKKIYYL